MLGGFPAVNPQTEAFYDIQESGQDVRSNRRDTRVITVSPKDEFRYGYRLWIDETTAMPLKTQLCDGHGRVIEQIVFASLTLSSKNSGFASSNRMSPRRVSSGCAMSRSRGRSRRRMPHWCGMP